EVVAIRQGYLGPDELDALLREALATQPGREGSPGAGAGPAGPRARAGTEPTRPRPKSEAQLALAGYCPVSLISDRRLVRGQTEYTVQHEGKLYRFASLVMSNCFRKD